MSTETRLREEICRIGGSLYARVLLDQRALGVLAPVGGTLLMLGWLMLFLASVRNDR